MDSTLETVVNVAENGNSTEKELNNDVITIKVALAPKKDIDCEIESPAIKSEQNDGSDIKLIESTENEVDGKSSVTESLTDIIDTETTIQSDSNEVISDTDTKTTDSAIEKLPPSKVDSELKMEASLDPQDKSKTLVDAEEEAPNVEDSEDDGEESFSEDEDPNEPTTISSELAVENYNKTEIVTPNESLNEKEKRSLEKTLHEDKKEEGLSTDHKELENGSIRSEVSIKKPNNIVDASILDQNKKLEEQIPVQSEVSDTKTDESDAKLDQKDFNNQIKDIISDIDINIKAQEKITELKEQELKLIQKQNELANQIHQQQLLAQKLNEQNQLKQQQNQWEAELESRRYQQSDRQSQPITTQPKETTNVSKTNVDLRKIFTPATDTPEILPKNRKLYASSAFYSPTLHPTVEDQVELARRISHSLSDISNQTSKGQSMYVNRKKRSVKWVHEGSCQGNNSTNNYVISSNKANSDTNSPSLFEVSTKLEKMPLKLVMNPKGQVRDYNSLKELINVETGLLSPDNCAELITALQLHQGRGAELFAKRRKKADNWIVDETNAGTQSLPSGIPDYQQYQPRPKAISPNILPAYSDAGKHRVQLNIHQNQLIEKYSKGGVQVVKSPWEAALQTGSASSAFLEESQGQCPTVSPPTMYHRQSTPRDLTDAAVKPSFALGMTNNQQQREEPCINKSTAPTFSNPQRVLAYTPNVAQGWGGRSVELPKGTPNTFSEYFESKEANELPWQNCDQCCTTYDCENMDFVYTEGKQLSGNFTIDVEKRLNQLENFQKKFMEQHQLRNENACDLSKKNIEIDEKINVRELIQSFEQQSIMEKSKNCPNYEEANYINEGLYIPKEISLSSYAPPQQKQPTFAPSQNYESTFQPIIKSNLGSSVDIQSSNGRFPLSNSNPSGYSTFSLQPNYQKVPTNNIAPQVNFNPSPLSFDKLSRYENPSVNQNQQQYQNIRQKKQVQNASPIPFGASSQPRSPICSMSSMGTSPQPQRLSSVPYHRSSNQDQSFNKLPRGWGDVQNNQHQQAYITPPTLSRNVPYTEIPYSDF